MAFPSENAVCSMTNYARAGWNCWPVSFPRPRSPRRKQTKKP